MALRLLCSRTDSADSRPPWWQIRGDVEKFTIEDGDLVINVKTTPRTLDTSQHRSSHSTSPRRGHPDAVFVLQALC